MIAGGGPHSSDALSRVVRGPALALAFALGVGAISARLLEAPDASAAQTRATAEDRLAEQQAFLDGLAVRADRVLEIAKGENLRSVLARAGAEPAETRALLESLRAVYQVDDVRSGQTLQVYFESDGAAARLSGVAFRAEPGITISANRTADGAYRARTIQMPIMYEVAHLSGAVKTSLYETALEGGATDREVAQLADVFGYEVDFQRDVRPGDRLEMVFERFRDDAGETVKTGDMYYVALQVGGRMRGFYRFDQRSGPAWFDENGRSARRFLMKTPINGARLSSGFGLRKHPILGYSALHKGADFAAPVGTPIMAAGDGIVERAGWNGGYGNYVRIGHDGGYDTAYGHMSRIAKGVRPGRRVSQGQIIGYVGSTGRSTGPHLHYEVLFRNAHVNPMKLRIPTGTVLTKAELKAFEEEKARIDALRGTGLRAEARAVLVKAEPTPSRGADLKGAFN